MPASEVLRVMVADDHTLVRAGIRALLDGLEGIQVVGEAGDGHEVLRRVAESRPDIVLMDIGMPGLNGLDATARIARDFPNVRVIILSMHRQEQYVWQALKAGAVGYLLKDSAINELAEALQKVARGEGYFCQEIASGLPKGFLNAGIAERGNRLDSLTARQREILQLVAEGQTTKAIADLLKISPKTVEYHRQKLMDCLNIHDVPGLVRFAVRAGLVSEDH